MSRALVDIITIGGVILVYLFLFWVARAMKAHLGAAPGAAAAASEHRLEVKPTANSSVDVQLKKAKAAEKANATKSRRVVRTSRVRPTRRPRPKAMDLGGTVNPFDSE